MQGGLLSFFEDLVKFIYEPVRLYPYILNKEMLKN